MAPSTEPDRDHETISELFKRKFYAVLWMISKCNRGYVLPDMVALCFSLKSAKQTITPGSEFTIPQILQRLVTIHRVHSKLCSEQLNLKDAHHGNKSIWCGTPHGRGKYKLKQQ
jgi:hypothetical protein